MAVVGGDIANAAWADWMTRRAVELAPDRHETWIQRADVLFRAGKIDECLSAVDRAIALEPNSPTLWINKAMMLEGVGRLDEAVEVLGKAIESASGISNKVSQRTDALLRRSVLLKRLGR